MAGRERPPAGSPSASDQPATDLLVLVEHPIRSGLNISRWLCNQIPHRCSSEFQLAGQARRDAASQRGVEMAHSKSRRTSSSRPRIHLPNPRARCVGHTTEVAGPNDLPQRTPYIIAHTLCVIIRNVHAHTQTPICCEHTYPNQPCKTHHTHTHTHSYS